MRVPSQASFNVRYVVGLIVLAAVVLTVSPAHAKRLAIDAPASEIFRCDMNNGHIIFSDAPCKGARKVAPWQPSNVTPGLQRSALPAPKSDDEAVSYGRVDPFVTCRAKGGQFLVASRLCVLPAAKRADAIQRIESTH